LGDIQRVVSDHSSLANKISLIEVYKGFLNKEKVLYTSLNKLKKGEKLFLGYCWIPRCERDNTFRQIESIKEKNKNIEIPTLQLVHDHTVKPPSMFKTNEFTAVF
jgi:vacuolar-type H+-ATPase subunit I/STV1